MFVALRRSFLLAVSLVVSASVADGLAFTLNESQVLAVDDGNSLHYLDLSGNRLIAGGRAAAYVFEADTAGLWHLDARLSIDAPPDEFVSGVAIDGDSAIISSGGRAHFFERDAGTWDEVLTTTSHRNYADISLDGTTAVLVSHPATARTYHRGDRGWSFVSEDRVASSYPFVADIDLSDGTLIVADMYESLITGRGASQAYIYETNRQGEWEQLGAFGPRKGSSTHFFPSEVTTDGGIAAGVGLFGSHPHIWERDEQGAWRFTTDIDTEQDYVGDIAIDGTLAVFPDRHNLSAGSLIAQRQFVGTWTDVARLKPAEIGYLSNYGRFAAFEGDWVAISGGGSIYMFDLRQLPSADFDSDGDVDGDDYLTWMINYPLAADATPEMGDADTDGDIDGDDFLIWQSQFWPGHTAQVDPTHSVSLPEPATLVGALLCSVPFRRFRFPSLHRPNPS